MSGRVVIESFDSRILSGNPMGDPTRRRFVVYLPPTYDRESARRFPVLYVLQGFAGRALAVENVSTWGETLSERLDRLIESGACGPLIAVAPECGTRLGGSQYLSSSATGRYEEYLIDEIVPLIDERYRTIAHAGGRGLVGKSSGGFGALVLGMRHPDVFGAMASHAGDMGFEYAYFPDFPKVIAGLGDPPDIGGFIEAFMAKPKKSSREFAVINVLAMASCYSPNPDAPQGFDLPFDLVTGELIDDVWRCWLAWDPVRMVERHADALRSARLVYLDCGRRDNYNLHLGARRLSRKLDALEIDHVYEELDDDHFGLSYRYDVSIPALVSALE